MKVIFKLIRFIKIIDWEREHKNNKMKYSKMMDFWNLNVKDTVVN